MIGETLCLLKNTLDDVVNRQILIYGSDKRNEFRITKQSKLHIGKTVLCNQLINQLLTTSVFSKIIVLGSSDHDIDIDTHSISFSSTPVEFVHDNYEARVAELLKTCDDRIVIINDINKKHYASSQLKDLLLNGRHYNITTIVLAHQPNNHEIFNNSFDKVYICQLNDNHLKTIYEKHVSMIPTFNLFKQIYNTVCKNNTYLAIDNLDKSNSFINMVKWGNEFTVCKNNVITIYNKEKIMNKKRLNPIRPQIIVAAQKQESNIDIKTELIKEKPIKEPIEESKEEEMEEVGRSMEYNIPVSKNRYTYLQALNNEIKPIVANVPIDIIKEYENIKEITAEKEEIKISDKPELEMSFYQSLLNKLTWFL
jgi:hypothetical protein